MSSKSRKALGRLTLRPWSEFLDTSRFNAPSHTLERVQTNVIYYQANYLCIALLFLVYVIIAKPSFLITLAFVAALGYYLFVHRKGAFIINGQVLPRSYIQLGYGAFGVFSFFYAGSATALWSLILAATVSILHALFRMRSLKSRGTSALDMFSGQSPVAAALNSLDSDADPENPHKQALQKRGADARANFRADMRAKMREKYLS